MKGEKLMDALGKIDDRLVASAMPVPRERKRNPWPVVAAATAAGLLITAFAWLLPRPADETVVHLAGEYVAEQEKVLDPFPLPALAEKFPATVSEAAELGIVLQSAELRNIIPPMLPVFQQAGASPVPDYAAMKALARELGAKLDMEGEPAKYGKTVTLSDAHTITVDSAMTAEIIFETPLSLPAAYDLTTNEGAWLAAAWIRANYLRDTDLEKLHTEVVGSDETGWEVRVCDAAKDSRWYEIDTGVLRLVLGKNGVEKIYLRSMDAVSSLGDYPVYNLREARDRVTAGYGYCALEEPPEVPMFDTMGLTYLEFDDTDIGAPFYWFAATLENGQEGLWFLPAVQEQYLKAHYRWKNTQYDNITEKLLCVSTWDAVSDDVRRAFANFLTDMEVDDDYLDFDMYFSVTGDTVLLHCRGPLMVTTGKVQTFQYDTKTGTVSWGASGVWEEEPYDAAEGIRRMLLQRSKDRQYVGYDYDQCVREAFALYFLENPTLLAYLPVFDENISPDWESLLLFTLLNSGLGETFTEAELDAAIGMLMDGVTYTHGSSSEADYGKGIYQALARGLSENPIYYRPEMAYWDPDNNVWEMVLTGYEFYADDFLPQTKEHSPNWEIFSRWSADHQDMNEDALAQFFDAAILECLYSDTVTPETVGLLPSQYVTVRFRLQEGDHPLQFVSCQRMVACGQ